MNKKFTKLIAAFALLAFMTPAMVGWGQTREDQTWSHEFVSPEAVSSNSITVDGATWNISTTVGAGSPTIDKGNSYSKYCLKFGTGAKNYFSEIVFTTNYFNDKNVKSVSIQVLHNASKSSTFTATQGSTTIGTSNQTIGTSWTDVTVNTTQGSGGTLSFSYSPDACAVNIHSITVVYTTGGGSDPTLSIDPTSAEPFTYVVDNGPSASQLFEVTGSNLTEDITVSVEPTSAFEISDDDTSFGTDNLTLSTGDIVSVRLKAGLTLGDYDATLTIASAGATSLTLDLDGSVTNPPTYTVTYDGNGATSGTAPTDATAYSSGEPVTVLGPGTLAKTGHAFVLWNTEADGSGTDYDENDTFAITANTTLYAQWLPNSHTITMPANDSYGNYTRDPASSSVDYGTEVTLTYTPASGYENCEATWIINGTPIAGNKFNMPDADVTVTVTLTGFQWVLTNLEDLTPADVFVIVGNGYAMANNNGTSGAPKAKQVTIEDNKLTTFIADTLQWNLSGNSSDGYTFYPKGSATTWLYCNTTSSSGNNNNMRVGTGGRKVFELTTKSSNKYLVTKDSNTDRYVCLYNNSDWRGYVEGSITTTNTTFYKKVYSDPVSYKKSITGYGEGTDGWYLIASPVASLTPSTSNGFIATNADEYDLYYFDQSTTNGKWRNYKTTSTGGWDIISGKGYLYASKSNTTLTFTGQPYNGNGLVTLIYPANPDDLAFPGLNLIGNPLAMTATLNKTFYKMNAAGSGFEAQTEGSTVAAMEGVFVRATAANQTATFTATRGGQNVGIAKTTINVISSHGTVIDNTIVRFDNGETLEKFMLNEEGTKLCVPVSGKEYAIVNAQAEGEMPVNFKAAENGSYTLSFSTENVEMDYLHLIDNMTGADIDLLQTPSYTFNARTTDYASRFRLVFSANTVDDNTSTGSATFAYFNGSEWVVNSNGNATLQVVDVMGRVLSSETVNGNHNMNLNLSTGVYMLRLVNGNDVKTQKIVVR